MTEFLPDLIDLKIYIHVKTVRLTAGGVDLSKIHLFSPQTDSWTALLLILFNLTE